MTVQVLRDGLLFLVGLASIINEGWIRTGEPRLHLILLYAAMAGVPAFNPGDVASAVKQAMKRNSNNNHPPEHAGPNTLAFASLVGRTA